MSELRRRVAASPLARAAALPERLSYVAQHDGRILKNSARWLLQSREHTNFTYHLTALNRTHLSWFVAEVAGIPVGSARNYITELEEDGVLIEHIRRSTAASTRRRLADSEVRFHKRLGWYALIRALRPRHVVETGTDKGLGTVVLAAALIRNGHGRLTTIDVHPESGYLIREQYAQVVDRRLGDSLEVIKTLTEPVDFFLHDSLHTKEHEIAEFDAVLPRLSDDGVVLSDNASKTDALAEWAEAHQRRFLFFQERPEGHWYPGDGIGVSPRV